MNARPHRYAGYRSRIPNAHIARALGDADDVLREAVKADNLRRFREAHPANDRFAGPPRHYRIGEQTPLDYDASPQPSGPPAWVDRACKAFIVAVGIASVAIWWAI